MSAQPDRDIHTLAQEALVIESRLQELEREQQAPLNAYREAQVNLVVARAGKDACRAEFDVLRTRLMALLGAAKSLPSVK